jgi:polysaccharide pyruvyl transferase WcaK-like protein
MKIVLLGDVGGTGGYHTGDEAMAEAVIGEIGSRTEVSVIAVSGDAEDTTQRYGWATVPRIGFGAPLWTDAERDARLDAVLAAAAGDMDALPWGDPAWRLIQAVAEADAVVISGGGNLNSTWPEHIYERVALARLAAAFNKRHVVTGQTIGPHLTGRHGEHLGRTLTSAALVGTRDAASHDLAARLGVLPERLVSVVDDAAYLQPAETGTPSPDSPYVAATFAPHSGLLGSDEYVSAIAGLLDHVITTTGMRVLLIPHHGSVLDGVPTGDLVIHDRIAAAVGTSVESLPMMTAREVVAVTARAAMTISTRYHPVVFSLSASVPTLGISVDAYTSTKIRGAMANYGVDDYSISVASLVHGGARAAVDDLASRAQGVTQHLSLVNAVRRGEAASWWDAVVATLTGVEGPPPADLGPVPSFEAGAWFSTGGALRDWSYAVSARLEADHLASRESRSEIHRLEDDILKLEREAARLSADLEMAADEIDALRVSAEAAHKLVSDPLRPLPTWLEDLPTIEALRAELDAVYSSRTFRYLRGPRQLYARLRSR